MLILNVIFLDIDGVLNSMPYFENLKSETSQGEKYNQIGDFHLKMLSKIYHECDAKIVLASTWRDLEDSSDEDGYLLYQYLIECLEKYDMKIFSKTPIIQFNRPLEIFTWLKNFNVSDIRYVILDDDFSKDEYQKYNLENHLVQTKFFCKNISEGGIQKEHVYKAIEILKK